MPDERTHQSEEEPGLIGTAVATPDVPVKKPAKRRPAPKLLPPYRVLLHNDDVNTFDHVIGSILKLTTLSTQEALVKTIAAHEAGVVLLLMTHRERAELYQEQFMSLMLTVTIEPAEG